MVSAVSDGSCYKIAPESVVRGNGNRDNGVAKHLPRKRQSGEEEILSAYVIVRVLKGIVACRIVWVCGTHSLRGGAKADGKDRRSEASPYVICRFNSAVVGKLVEFL